MVRPILEFSSSVWSPWQEENVNKLEAVQKRAARFVMNIPKYDHTSITKLIKEDLKWETLKERRENTRVTNLYKIINGNLKVPINYHPIHSNTITRTEPHTFLQYQTIVNPYKYSFFPATIVLWNNLPYHTASSPSLEEFKTRLQNPSLIPPQV